MKIHLDDEQRRQLEELARRQGRSAEDILAELVRNALRESQDNGARVEAFASNGEPTCLELAMASGFVGVDEELPQDLSRNPDHLDGFGRD